MLAGVLAVRNTTAATVVGYAFSLYTLRLCHRDRSRCGLLLRMRQCRSIGRFSSRLVSRNTKNRGRRASKGSSIRSGHARGLQRRGCVSFGPFVTGASIQTIRSGGRLQSRLTSSPSPRVSPGHKQSRPRAALSGAMNGPRAGGWSSHLPLLTSSTLPRNSNHPLLCTCWWRTPMKARPTKSIFFPSEGHNTILRGVLHSTCGAADGRVSKQR